MRLHEDMSAWHADRRELDGSVGFVPTMGALHAGHASLIERSVAENEHTILSIFVNPTQFNDAADLTHYPRTLAADLDLAERLGVSNVLLPDYRSLYPDDFRYRVDENQFSNEFCGAHRPGHFAGVLTVVMKLLNLVRPAKAYFGEKDYQQYLLIRDMCEAFFLEVEIIPCPTVRECDGLARSSRNTLLDARSRELAPTFARLLASELDDLAVGRALEEAGFAVDYVATSRGRRFGAVIVCGDGREVRLIDNVPLRCDGISKVAECSTRAIRGQRSEGEFP